MGSDGGLAFVPVHPKATVVEAVAHLEPFFTFSLKGCDWGDDSRNEWLEENDYGHAICISYGTDIYSEHVTPEEVMSFLYFLEGMIKELGMENTTFGDVLLDKDTRPSWDPVKPMDRRFYRVIEEATETHNLSVVDWINGLKNVLEFTEFYGERRVMVSMVETWT